MDIQAMKVERIWTPQSVGLNAISHLTSRFSRPSKSAAADLYDHETQAWISNFSSYATISPEKKLWLLKNNGALQG